MSNTRENSRVILKTSLINQSKNFLKDILASKIDNYLDYDIAEQFTHFYCDNDKIDYKKIEEDCVALSKNMKAKINKYKYVREWHELTEIVDFMTGTAQLAQGKYQAARDTLLPIQVLDDKVYVITRLLIACSIYAESGQKNDQLDFFIKAKRYAESSQQDDHLDVFIKTKSYLKEDEKLLSILGMPTPTIENTNRIRKIIDETLTAILNKQKSHFDEKSRKGTLSALDEQSLERIRSDLFKMYAPEQTVEVRIEEKLSEEHMLILRQFYDLLDTQINILTSEENRTIQEKSLEIEEIYYAWKVEFELSKIDNKILMVSADKLLESPNLKYLEHNKLLDFFLIHARYKLEICVFARKSIKNINGSRDFFHTEAIESLANIIKIAKKFISFNEIIRCVLIKSKDLVGQYYLIQEFKAALKKVENKKVIESKNVKSVYFSTNDADIYPIDIDSIISSIAPESINEPFTSKTPPGTLLTVVNTTMMPILKYICNNHVKEEYKKICNEELFCRFESENIDYVELANTCKKYNSGLYDLNAGEEHQPFSTILNYISATCAIYDAYLNKEICDNDRKACNANGLHQELNKKIFNHSYLNEEYNGKVEIVFRLLRAYVNALNGRIIAAKSDIDRTQSLLSKSKVIFKDKNDKKFKEIQKAIYDEIGEYIVRHPVVNSNEGRIKALVQQLKSALLRDKLEEELGSATLKDTLKAALKIHNDLWNYAPTHLPYQPIWIEYNSLTIILYLKLCDRLDKDESKNKANERLLIHLEETICASHEILIEMIDTSNKFFNDPKAQIKKFFEDYEIVRQLINNHPTAYRHLEPHDATSLAFKLKVLEFLNAPAVDDSKVIESEVAKNETENVLYQNLEIEKDTKEQVGLSRTIEEEKSSTVEEKRIDENANELEVKKVESIKKVPQIKDPKTSSNVNISRKDKYNKPEVYNQQLQPNEITDASNQNSQKPGFISHDEKSWTAITKNTMMPQTSQKHVLLSKDKKSKPKPPLITSQPSLTNKQKISLLLSDSNEIVPPTPQKIEAEKSRMNAVSQEEKKREAAARRIEEQKKREAEARRIEEQKKREIETRRIEEQKKREIEARRIEEEKKREAAARRIEEEKKREAAARRIEEEKKREIEARRIEEETKREIAEVPHLSLNAYDLYCLEENTSVNNPYVELVNTYNKLRLRDIDGVYSDLGKFIKNKDLDNEKVFFYIKILFSVLFNHLRMTYEINMEYFIAFIISCKDNWYYENRAAFKKQINFMILHYWRKGSGSYIIKTIRDVIAKLKLMYQIHDTLYQSDDGLINRNLLNTLLHDLVKILYCSEITNNELEDMVDKMCHYVRTFSCADTEIFFRQLGRFIFDCLYSNVDLNTTISAIATMNYPTFDISYLQHQPISIASQTPYQNYLDYASIIHYGSNQVAPLGHPQFMPHASYLSVTENKNAPHDQLLKEGREENETIANNLVAPLPQVEDSLVQQPATQLSRSSRNSNTFFQPKEVKSFNKSATATPPSTAAIPSSASLMNKS